MPENPSGDPIKLLCVDDEPAFLELTKAYLERRDGMKVTTASSAAAAMDMLERQPFDAIVSDYQMPIEDGLQFLDRLRRNGVRLPFILFTGKGREEVAIQALNQGADHYVQKGGEPKAQFAAVAHAVRQSVEKRAAENAIREGEARLKATLSAAPTGIGVVTNRVIMEVNDRLCEMTGFPREELVGMSARMLYPTQEDFDYVGREKYDQISRVGTGTVETRWLRKDGRIIDIVLSSAPIKPTDLAYGVVFTALDITPMRRMVRELQDSEERWKFALEGAGDGVFDWDIKSGTVYFSPRYKAILGFEEGAFGSDPGAWRDRIHPDDREMALGRLDAYLKGEIPEYSVEHRLQCRDGTYKWVLARGKVVAKDSGGAPQRMIGTHSDISRRKESEQALAVSEANLRMLTDNIEDMVTRVDAGNRIVYISPSVTRELGYSPEELLGRPSSIHVHPEDIEGVTGEFRNAVRDRASRIRLIYRYRKASGEFIWTETETHLFYKEGYEGAIFVSRDISARKHAEVAAARANAKLQLLNTLTRHDIMNQVAILHSYIELDRMEAPEGAARERLARRELATRNIESMVDFMRDYQSMGESPPTWQEVAGSFRRAAEAFDLSHVDVDLKMDGLEIFADRLLEKVFHNLIDNTLRHGGGVSRIGIAVDITNPKLQIIYEDDGEGISDEERPLIFEMGYGRNTGLGLFLAKEILELTGMSMSEAGEGKGARFVISVPEGAWRRR